MNSALKQGLRTLLGALITMLVASVLVFTALQFVPGNPAVEIAGSDASPEQVAQIEHRLGLDQSAWLRYFDWLFGVLRGDLGTSYHYQQSVWSLLQPRIGNTLLLDLYATLLVILFGVGLGILATRVPKLNGLVTVITSVLIGLPSFVAAVLLIHLFAVKLGWFPAVGAGGPGLGSKIVALTLPSIALSLAWTAFLGQIARASLRDQASREHVETARGRGLSSGSVFWRHIFRNGAVPIVTVVSLTGGGLIAGSVVVEKAFALDGIGSFLVQSVISKDASVVLAIVMILVVIFVVLTTIADLLHLWLDPRLRKGRT
ncbi:ABC transporter permease [Nocardioides sp.]|uniref:ABC transporter permease n=1 Tax=Nocardioides sp. TaxID=35761 RepID=UPI0039E52179